MPKYKAIRGIIVSQEPLIKTTTNKIKRHENLKLIKEEKKKERIMKLENLKTEFLGRNIFFIKILILHNQKFGE